MHRPIHSAPALPRRPTGRGTVERVLVVVVAAVGLFQLGHLGEHAAQTWAWLMAPAAPAASTPLGAAALRVVAGFVDGPLVASELVHLLGNAMLLLGVGAAVVLARRRGRAGPVAAMWVQVGHALEHVVLVVTSATYGQAVGLSTLPALLLGRVSPAAVGWRVWLHLGLNVLVVGLLVIYVRATAAAPTVPADIQRPPSRVRTGRSHVCT